MALYLCGAIRLTPRASALLRKLKDARSSEYELGLSLISKELHDQLVSVLERVVADIEATRKGERRRHASNREVLR